MKKLTASVIVFILLIQAILFINPLGKGTSSTWYVSPTGNDNNPGDIQHPFQTIQHAIQASDNGDTIYLRAGNYNILTSSSNGILIDRSGTPESWYTISGYPGERAVINGHGYTLPPNYALLRIGTATTGQSYVRITNLVVENSTRDGIRAAQLGTKTSHHLRIDNVTINFCNYRGLMFWSTNPNKAWCHNITVENCLVNNTQLSLSMGEGVTFSGCKDVVFHHNTLKNCPKIMLDLANNTKNCKIYKNTIITTFGTGIKLDGSQSTKVSAWDENISITDNLFLGRFTAIKIGVEKKGGCKNITIANNIINTVSSYPGLKLEGVTGYSQLLDDILITHNTIQVSGSGSPLQIELPKIKLQHIVVTNNIFQGDGTSSWQVRSSLSNSTDPCFHFSHNLYNHTTKPENTAWANGKGKFEATAIRASAQFFDRGAGDFHLTNTSPAIDAADMAYTVSSDYDGINRPQNTVSDIGAYEVVFEQIHPPGITNVRISQDTQEVRRSLVISWNIIENGYQIEDSWVTIIYPDETTHTFSAPNRYYLNQAYSQVGTYRFSIGVRDEYNNTNQTTSYAFHIIPRLNSALVIGFITVENASSSSVVSIRAKLLLYLELNPLRLQILSSNENIIISRDYVGGLGPQFIIGIFNGVVLPKE